MANRAGTFSMVLLLTMVVCSALLPVAAADMNESEAVIAQRAVIHRLHTAVRTGDVAGIDAALAAGAPLNESAALQLAILMDRKDLVDLLIARGADLNRPDQGGELPVVTALKRGNESLMQHLVERGAAVDQSDRFGRSAIEHAQALGRPEAAAWLSGQRPVGNAGPRESALGRP